MFATVCERPLRMISGSDTGFNLQPWQMRATCRAALVPSDPAATASPSAIRTRGSAHWSAVWQTTWQYVAVSGSSQPEIMGRVPTAQRTRAAKKPRGLAITAATLVCVKHVIVNPLEELGHLAGYHRQIFWSAEEVAVAAEQVFHGCLARRPPDQRQFRFHARGRKGRALFEGVRHCAGEARAAVPHNKHAAHARTSGR